MTSGTAQRLVYDQQTGRLYNGNTGELIGLCRSGSGPYLNDPAHDYVKKDLAHGRHYAGPIPAKPAPYPVDSFDPHHGFLDCNRRPFQSPAFHLEGGAHGRDGFCIHGPIGNKGCIEFTSWDGQYGFNNGSHKIIAMQHQGPVSVAVVSDVRTYRFPPGVHPDTASGNFGLFDFFGSNRSEMCEERRSLVARTI